MKDIKITEKVKAWADKEYDELRYSKCEKKNFVFTSLDVMAWHKLPPYMGEK